LGARFRQICLLFLTFFGTKPRKLLYLGSGVRCRWLLSMDKRCLWRHKMRSYSRFQINVTAKFVDTMYFILTDTHFPYFMCHCIDYKLSAFQVRIPEQDALNATTEHSWLQKYEAAPWNMRVKHSALRQRSSQLLKHSDCVDTSSRAQTVCCWNGAHPGLLDRHRTHAKLQKNWECT